MAKRSKKYRGEVAEQSPFGGSKRVSVSIEPAENGAVIEVCHDGKDGYQRKRLVAANERSALRIAASHLHGAEGKKKGKSKGGKKKVSARKSM